MPGIETIRRPSSVIINTRELQGKFPVRSISFDVRERVMFLMKVASFQNKHLPPKGESTKHLI